MINNYLRIAYENSPEVADIVDISYRLHPNECLVAFAGYTSTSLANYQGARYPKIFIYSEDVAGYEISSTLHELTHFINDVIFENKRKPYYLNDTDAKLLYASAMDNTIANLESFYNSGEFILITEPRNNKQVSFPKKDSPSKDIETNLCYITNEMLKNLQNNYSQDTSVGTDKKMLHFKALGDVPIIYYPSPLYSP